MILVTTFYAIVDLLAPWLIIISFAVIVCGAIHALVIYSRAKNTLGERDKKMFLTLAITNIILLLLPILGLTVVNLEFFLAEDVLIDTLLVILALVSPPIFCVTSLYLFASFIPKRLGKRKVFLLYVLAPIIFVIGVLVWGIIGYIQPVGGPGYVGTGIAPPLDSNQY